MQLNPGCISPAELLSLPRGRGREAEGDIGASRRTSTCHPFQRPPLALKPHIRFGCLQAPPIQRQASLQAAANSIGKSHHGQAKRTQCAAGNDISAGEMVSGLEQLIFLAVI